MSESSEQARNALITGIEDITDFEQFDVPSNGIYLAVYDILSKLISKGGRVTKTELRDSPSCKNGSTINTSLTRLLGAGVIEESGDGEKRLATSTRGARIRASTTSYSLIDESFARKYLEAGRKVIE